MLITGVRVQVPPRAPRRSKVRFAPTSFYATGKKDVIRPLPCSSFPTATRCAGLAVGGPPCGRHFRSEGNIDFNRPFHKKRTSAKQLSFSCGFRRPFGRLHPSVIEMLGGSTRKGYATSVRRQSRQRLCGEFRLRRGFACGKTLVRRIGAAGQKAGWVVLLYLFEISCGRNVRFAATSFYTCGKKEAIRPIPAPPLQPRPALRAAFTIEKPSTLTVSPTRRKHSVLSAGFCDILVYYNDERSRLWSLTG